LFVKTLFERGDADEAWTHFEDVLRLFELNYGIIFGDIEKYSSFLKPDKVSWVDITFTEE